MSRIKVNKAEPFTKDREVSIEGLRCLDTASEKNGVIKYKNKQFLFREDNKWKTLDGSGTESEYKIEYAHKHHISPEQMVHTDLLSPGPPANPLETPMLDHPKIIMPMMLPFPPHLGGGVQMAISSMAMNGYGAALITHPLPRGPGMELLKVYCTYWCGPAVPLEAAECAISYSNINDKPVFDPAFEALSPAGGPAAPPPEWYNKLVTVSDRVSHSANPPAILYDHPPLGGPTGPGDWAIPALNNLTPDLEHSTPAKRAAVGLHTVEYTLVDPLPLYGDTVSRFNMWLIGGAVNQTWAYYGTTLVTKTTLDVIPK